MSHFPHRHTKNFVSERDEVLSAVPLFIEVSFHSKHVTCVIRFRILISPNQLPDALHRSFPQNRFQPMTVSLCQFRMGYSFRSQFLPYTKLYYATFKILSTAFCRFACNRLKSFVLFCRQFYGFSPNSTHTLPACQTTSFKKTGVSSSSFFHSFFNVSVMITYSSFSASSGVFRPNTISVSTSAGRAP